MNIKYLKAEDLYKLQKHQILLELQGEVLSWAKRRFWMIFIIIAIIGLIGVPTLLELIASSEIDRTLDSTKQARDRAEIAALFATEAAMDATKKVQDAEKLASDVQEQFTKIKAQFEAKSANVRNESRLGLTELEGRLAALEKSIAHLAKEAVSPELAESIETTQMELASKASERQSNFRNNADYRVEVSMPDLGGSLSNAVIDELRQVGFETAVYYNTSPRLDEHLYGLKEGTLGNNPLVAFRGSKDGKVQEIVALLKSIDGIGTVEMAEKHSKGSDKIFSVWLPKSD